MLPSPHHPHYCPRKYTGGSGPILQVWGSEGLCRGHPTVLPIHPHLTVWDCRNRAWAFHTVHWLFAESNYGHLDENDTASRPICECSAVIRLLTTANTARGPISIEKATLSLKEISDWIGNRRQMV